MVRETFNIGMEPESTMDLHSQFSLPGHNILIDECDTVQLLHTQHCVNDRSLDKSTV